MSEFDKVCRGLQLIGCSYFFSTDGDNVFVNAYNRLRATGIEDPRPAAHVTVRWKFSKRHLDGVAEQFFQWVDRDLDSEPNREQIQEILS